MSGGKCRFPRTISRLRGRRLPPALSSVSRLRTTPPAPHHPKARPSRSPPACPAALRAVGGGDPREHMRGVPGRWEMPLTCQPQESDPRQRDPVHLPQLPIHANEHAKWERHGRGQGRRRARAVAAAPGAARGAARMGPGAPPPGSRSRSAPARAPAPARLRLRLPHARLSAAIPRPAAPPANGEAAAKVSGSRAGPGASAESPSAPGARGPGKGAGEGAPSAPSGARTRCGPSGGALRALGSGQPGLRERDRRRVRDPPGLE